MQNFDWLNDYAGDYKPDAGGIRDKLEILKDGRYDFEIMDARWDETQNGDRLLKVGLRVLPGSGVIEHAYWLNEQKGINRLAADLLALGFGSDQWGSTNHPLSREIPAAVLKLPGIRFAGSKGSYEAKSDGKPRHTLKVLTRISGSGNGRAMPPVANRPPVQDAEDTVYNEPVPADIPF